MRINYCIVCARKFESPDGFIFNTCDNCETAKEFGFPALRSTVSLHTMKNVSAKRLAELDKRVMLPDLVKDKDYVCGTKERGKYTDRQIDIRS